MQKQVTNLLAYSSPIGAIRNGKAVQIIAHGDREGSSPVFQFCNPDTGKFEWASQNEFSVLDGRFPLSDEVLRQTVQTMQSQSGRQNQSRSGVN